MSPPRGKAASRPAWRAIPGRFRLEALLAGIAAVLFGNYLFSDQLLFGTDSIPGGLFFRGLLVDFVRTFHELPRWNPYILGGLPFLDATHGDTFFPSSLLQFLMPVYRGLGHKLILHVVLAGVFMGFYLRTLALRPIAVWWGSVAYMLSPVLVSYLYAGQDGKIYVTSLTPLVLGLLERAMITGSVRNFALFGISVGLAILSAQVQMAYHLLWIVAGVFVLRLFVPLPGGATPSPATRARRFGLFGGALAVGLLVAAVQLLPAVAYVKNPEGFSVRSTRTDYEHATSWCLHPEEIAAMVVPEFCNSPDGYWGRNPFKINSDAPGILVLFLAALALRRRDATRLFLAGTAAFCVLYALGEHTPIHRICYAIVPQVKLFRAPPLLMFGAAFALAALAAHALHDLDAARGARGGKHPALAWGLPAAAVLALAGLAGGGVLDFWNGLLRPGLEAPLRQAQLANLPEFRGGALAAAAVLAAGAALLHAGRRGSLPWIAFAAGFVTLTVADLWRIDRRFVAVTDPRPFIQAPALLARLSAESAAEKFRVMPVAQGLTANEMGYFGIESTLGFHDNELAWYRALRTEPAAEGLLAGNGAGYPFLRILNVKYIVHDRSDLPNPYLVPDWLPRFRLAGSWERAEGSAAVAARLVSADFDPARTVLLEEDPGIPPAPPGADADLGTVDYEYDGNTIRVRAEAARACLLVHSENWFPYWHAFRDGEEIPILRAYGTLRAIALPAGRSEIELRFRSAPYETGRNVTLLTLGVLALAGVAAWARGRARS